MCRQSDKKRVDEESDLRILYYFHYFIGFDNFIQALINYSISLIKVSGLCILFTEFHECGHGMVCCWFPSQAANLMLIFMLS